MTFPTARLVAGLLACTLAVGAPQTRAQQESVRDLLISSYALWGMMAAASDFCWEVASFDVAYKEAHQNWLARNDWARAELDTTLDASGEPRSLASDGEAAGGKGIADILAQATNKEEACANWLAETDGLGRFEPETFLSHQLGILRERGGM